LAWHRLDRLLHLQREAQPGAGAAEGQWSVISCQWPVPSKFN
jgi:hypothetical protein